MQCLHYGSLTYHIQWLHLVCNDYCNMMGIMFKCRFTVASRYMLTTFFDLATKFRCLSRHHLAKFTFFVLINRPESDFFSIIFLNCVFCLIIWQEFHFFAILWKMCYAFYRFPNKIRVFYGNHSRKSLYSALFFVLWGKPRNFLWSFS